MTSFTTDEIFPPTFSIDVGLDNGTSYGIVFSLEKMVLGIVRGQWSENDVEISGISTVRFIISPEYVFHGITSKDAESFLSSVRQLEQLILTGYLDLNQNTSKFLI